MIYASETSNKQPSIDELKLGSDMEPREITSIIQRFNSKGFIATSCEKDEEGKFTEYMNLDGFYEKLSNILSQDHSKQLTNQAQQNFKDLFQYIESLFARPISPYEIETLNQWIDVDKHDFTLIRKR